ncbi:sensor histidine kinase [Streptomyces sp. NBC_01351]|uniref:sensor histidine kinase n=1 Tax=Streptomyces sp. NBC_01351 TaxID=2903833 RepID=UPI002E34B8B5|nr:sensor histidine kinase [Streptomyces sp. NBC_01351]
MFLSRQRLIVVDAVLAPLLVFASYLAIREPPTPEPVAVSWAMAVAVGGPVAVRRVHPLAAFAVVWAAVVVAFAAGMVPDYASPAPYACLALVLYTAALGGRWEPLVAALGAGLLLARDVGPWPLVLLAFAAPWGIGRYVRERRAFAERSALQLAEHAVTGERLRIAREMHDIVAHSLSVITVKAAIAAHVADVRPQETREALRHIEETGRQALAEMRSTLAVLRTPEGTPEEPGAPEVAPAPGLSDLAAVADRAARAGVEVTLEVAELPPLAPGLELAAYRIVQEAVTNVIKHAAPTTCRVTVTRDLRIMVVNEGDVLPGHTPGHGLTGIRERVAMYQGEFTAGPRPEGGFRVSARLASGAGA